MIHFLVILNLLILPILFWRLFAFAFAFAGLLLWKLRYACLATFAALFGFCYYSWWCGQHPVTPTVQVQDSVLEWNKQHPEVFQAAASIPAPNPTPMPQYNINFSTDPVTGKTTESWIPVTGQPTNGPIPVTGQP